MNEQLKDLIEKETGVKIDGKVTTDEIVLVYNLVKPVVEKFFPELPDYEDALIDKIEERAMKRTGLRKKVALAVCGALRTALKCPDDDDNITQK